MKTRWVQPYIDKEHLAHYWYGGDVVSIEHRGFTFFISADGEVNASLLDEKNNELCYVKDKNRSGRFYDEMSSFIANDKELFSLINSPEGEKVLVFENNNWWECYARDPAGNMYDLMWALDASTIPEAIEEVKEHIDVKVNELLVGFSQREPDTHFGRAVKTLNSVSYGPNNMTLIDRLPPAAVCLIAEALIDKGVIFPELKVGDFVCRVIDGKAQNPERVGAVNIEYTIDNGTGIGDVWWLKGYNLGRTTVKADQKEGE